MFALIRRAHYWERKPVISLGWFQFMKLRW